MLLPKQSLESANTVRVEFEMDARQRGVMCSYTQQEGFEILQRLMLNVIHDFNTAAMNADDDADIIRKQRNARVAAQFYLGFMERVTYEINADKQLKPVDGTIDNPEPSSVMPEFN